MDIPFRPIISGIVGAILAYLLTQWLGRRFPISPKPHSLAWYEARYSWVEKVCSVAFVAGLGVSLVLYRTVLSRNDPRGAAVGFVVACFLALGVLVAVTTLSRTHRFREYRDYQELKYGMRSSFGLCMALPFLILAIYGAVHLVIKGV